MYYYLTFYLSFNVFNSILIFSIDQLCMTIFPSPLYPFFLHSTLFSFIRSLVDWGDTMLSHNQQRHFVLQFSSATLCFPISNEDLNTQNWEFRLNNFAHIKSNTITLRYNWLNINISMMTRLEARRNFESKTLCSANRMSFEKLKSFMMKLYLTKLLTLNIRSVWILDE